MFGRVERARGQVRGALLGLGAAALFGLSAPLAKVLLGDVPPVLLAGLLYLGAASGLFLHRAVRPVSKESQLGQRDVPRLVGIVVAGGLLGPVLMLFGLQRVSSLTGSLLLNLEAPLTVLLAVALFREHLGRYAAIAVVCIFGGTLILKLERGPLSGDIWGLAFLGAACLCWALDNNLTQRLSLRDPFAIVRVKTLSAGLVNTAIGLLLARDALPHPTSIAAALVLGSLSYGVSVVLDAYALRLIGAAREAAYFATAPFVGAIMSLAIFDVALTLRTAIAGGAMVVGVVALLRERHSHLHEHESHEHEHLHTHDEHHQHAHDPSDPTGAPHSHPHRHKPLVHDHPHVPDAHHRHSH